MGSTVEPTGVGREGGEDGMTSWGRERERRGTEPLCAMALLSRGSDGIGPCGGPARWRLTFEEGASQCHSCDAHLAASIRARGTRLDLVELPAPGEPEPRAPAATSPNAPPPSSPTPPSPRARADRQTERPGAYSHVHVPHSEERPGVTRGAESGAPRRYPDGATPSPGGPEREPAGTPGHPE